MFVSNIFIKFALLNQLTIIDMKTKIILILKGVLFYIVTIFTILGICGVDSITEQGYLFAFLIIDAIGIYVCSNVLTISEIRKFCFVDFLNKIFGSDNF